MTCPFCKEDDFDEIGLKHHLLRGWCEAFEQVPSTDQPGGDPVGAAVDSLQRQLEQQNQG